MPRRGIAGLHGNSMDIKLGELWEIVNDREAVPGVTKGRTRLSG